MQAHAIVVSHAVAPENTERAAESPNLSQERGSCYVIQNAGHWKTVVTHPHAADASLAMEYLRVNTARIQPAQI